MKTTMMAAVAAACCLPAAAHADDWQVWTEMAPGTYDRTVSLAGGRDYALASTIADGEDSGGLRLTVSLAGTPIASVVADTADAVRGVTFRAPKDATYTLTLVIPAVPACTGSECGVTYQIASDCRADTSTLCRLPVGKAEPNRAWNFVKDDDWFRTTLRGRQRYEAWLHDPQDCVIAFRALDAKGREVPSSTIGHPGDGISIRFTPPTNGTYFIAASGSCYGSPDYGGPYGVALYAR